MLKRFGVILILLVIASQHPAPPVQGDILGWACSTTAGIAGGPYTILVCPAGDGPTLASIGATITVKVTDITGFNPLPNIPASDYWLIDCSGQTALCGGSASINADGPSDADGIATISGAIVIV